MSPTSQDKRKKSDRRLLRTIRIGLIISLSSVVAFMAIVAFYSLIPQVFYPTARADAFTPCPPQTAETCPPESCRDGIMLLRERLLEYAADQTRAPRLSDDAGWFTVWDGDYHSLTAVCGDTEVDGYRALSNLRYRVETDLEQMDEIYLPLLERLPPAPDEDSQ